MRLSANWITPWYIAASEGERASVYQYLDGRCDEVNWELIHLAMMSLAHTALFPLRDVLGMGSEGRMNTPRRASGNWGRHYTEGMLTNAVRDRLGALTETYGRAPRPPNAGAS